MGVKKSTVCTSARSARSRYTPASSAVAAPTSRLGSVVAVRPAHPPARAVCPPLARQPAQHVRQGVLPQLGGSAGAARQARELEDVLARHCELNLLSSLILTIE